MLFMRVLCSIEWRIYLLRYAGENSARPIKLSVIPWLELLCWISRVSIRCLSRYRISRNSVLLAMGSTWSEKIKETVIQLLLKLLGAGWGGAASVSGLLAHSEDRLLIISSGEWVRNTDWRPVGKFRIVKDYLIQNWLPFVVWCITL